MTKKSFKGNNPVMQFISTDTMYNTDQTHDVDCTYKAQDKGESKSKRLNLLLQPSIFENLSKIAIMKRTSVNDLINTILKNYNAEEAEAIKRYHEVFTE